MDRRRERSPADLGSGAHGMDEKASGKIRKIRPGDAFIPRRVTLDASLVSELYGRLLARPTGSFCANVLKALAHKKRRASCGLESLQPMCTHRGMTNHIAENSHPRLLQFLNS